MSDAQSIFIVLLCFYCFESLKFAPLGSYSIRSPLPATRRWNLQRPCLCLMGVRKLVFLAPLLPWPQYQLITAAVGEAGHRTSSIKKIDAIQAKLSYLKSETEWLRLCSLLLFLNYFLFLPLIYLRFGLGSYLYSTVALSYCLQALTALAFYAAHRKILRKEKGARGLHSFYCLVFPWHAMRAADELFLKSSLRWSQLALLGALAESAPAREQLALYWRQARFLKKAPYTAATLEPFLRAAGIDPEQAMLRDRPSHVGKYCPCCLGSYEMSAAKCIDCEGTQLLPTD